MHHVGTKTLKTQRLVLRQFRREDAQAMFDNWANDPEVTQYLTWAPHGDVELTRSLVEQWVADYDRENVYQWGIQWEDQLIGTISAVHIGERAGLVEIGYCMGRPWWHRGIMTEALTAVMDFFFREVGANHVTARCDARNTHSAGVMEKAGMRYEGTLRQYGWNQQGICDMAHYGLLRQEWEGK